MADSLEMTGKTIAQSIRSAARTDQGSMSDPELADDPVARALASRAFTAQIVAAQLGEFDADLARESLIRRWEHAGSPRGAFLRAALLASALSARITEDDSPLPEATSVSRNEQIAAAERAAGFLERIALDLQ